MLAMHYAFPLRDADHVASVRARIAIRGPAFDNLPGLASKLFLVDPIDPCYAIFYLWREPDAALAFLEGPLFQALVDAYGRPEVKLLLTTATTFPFATGSEVFLSTGASELAADAIRMVDPRRGEIHALASSGARRFEVMYRAMGGATATPRAVDTFAAISP